jgi:hypothetical protein
VDDDCRQLGIQQVQFMTEEFIQEQRALEFIARYNWYFASNSEQEEAAQKLVAIGLIKPLYDLVKKINPNKKGFVSDISTWAFAYVPVEYEIKDLDKAFSLALLNTWGIYECGGLEFDI